MNNNDIFRRLRYILDYSDSEMIAVFKAVELDVTRAELSSWLKQEDADDSVFIEDSTLAQFLNGLITIKRGKREGVSLPPIETTLNNNDIFRKLKIAFHHQADEILSLMASVDFIMSKHELSAFFRKPTHKHYRVCQEQILRKYLNALQLEYRHSQPLSQRGDDNSQ
ncbi:MAG: DUF1456 family protein [Pseudomonadota bacterium]